MVFKVRSHDEMEGRLLLICDIEKMQMWCVVHCCSHRSCRVPRVLKIVAVVVHKDEKSKKLSEQRCKKSISTDLCVLAFGAESANANFRACREQPSQRCTR